MARPRPNQRMNGQARRERRPDVGLWRGQPATRQVRAELHPVGAPRRGHRHIRWRRGAHLEEWPVGFERHRLLGLRHVVKPRHINNWRLDGNQLHSQLLDDHHHDNCWEFSFAAGGVG